jgi:hypothetical protein
LNGIVPQAQPRRKPSRDVFAALVAILPAGLRFVKAHPVAPGEDAASAEKTPRRIPEGGLEVLDQVKVYASSGLSAGGADGDLPFGANVPESQA